MPKRPHLTAIARSFSAAVVLLALTACTPRLLAPYDEVTDRSVSALQRQTEAHLIALEAAAGTPSCAFAHHQRFYTDARIDISALAVRTAAIPGNERTAEQTTLLLASLESLRQLHRLDCLSTEQIAILRSQFNSSFTAILRLELAKRRNP
ncbi:hypothetical protein [Azonexus sp.]|uniref:hypothetical protein n=1 Tax=Azonexus sp. TaxID=1872668 RepID=UPI0035AD7A7E